MVDWKEIEAQVYMRVARRTPVVIERGEGVWVWDVEGKRYLDLVGGWAVDTLGHSHPVLVEAISRQARTLIHTSNQFYTIPQLELADLLVRNSPLDRVFFANSGTEANEGVVKLARKWGKLHRNGAYEVITADHSFHGRTLAMVAATGKPAYRPSFEPMPAGFLNVPFNDIEALKRATTDRTVAVMLEPVQGEGGVNVADERYLGEVRRWCDEQGLLLILDEIQTGVGRCGTLWAHSQWGVEPDAMTLAKGLGGGVPIGAILAKEHAAVFEPGDHGSTFGGNPLACAAGTAVFRYVLDHDLPGHVARVGAHFKRRLENLRDRFPQIVEVRGRGLLLAIEFGQDLAAPTLSAALNEGLLVNQISPTTLRFMPPLIITEAEVDDAIGRLERAIARALAVTAAPTA